ANRDRNRVLLPYAAGTLGAILLFFLATTAFKANPFTRLDWTPLDGAGMNPQLQNPGMAIHPPNLYLGYVATAIPFAFAIAALVSRRLDAEWLAGVRRRAPISWIFLTIGIVLGTRWAYVERGASREAAFLYNNLVLVGIAFAVLWGTLFPILSQWATGAEKKITVGPPFFNTVNIPLGLLLLALTGIGPLIAWRRASLSNLRRQFAFPAGLGVVVGVLLLGLGMRSWHALIAYALCGFVSGTILQEFYKGVGARRSINGDSM